MTFDPPADGACFWESAENAAFMQLVSNHLSEPSASLPLRNCAPSLAVGQLAMKKKKKINRRSLACLLAVSLPPPQMYPASQVPLSKSRIEFPPPHYFKPVDCAKRYTKLGKPWETAAEPFLMLIFPQKKKKTLYDTFFFNSKLS